jgi:uncharacterized damage-inducible protein DinB
MPRGRPLEVEQELLEAFVRNGRATEYLVSVLPVEIWRTAPASGRGRTIAGIVAHIQSVRRTFARLAGARPGPPSLDQQTVTSLLAQRALRRSTDDLSRLFAQAIASRRARVKGMPRRVIDMLTYLMQHDAHHRGQITTLARDLGHTFGKDDVVRLWGWKALPASEDRAHRLNYRSRSASSSH